MKSRITQALLLPPEHQGKHRDARQPDAPDVLVHGDAPAHLNEEELLRVRAPASAGSQELYANLGDAS